MNGFCEHETPEVALPREGMERICAAGETELETVEQQEMDRFAQTAEVTLDVAEQREMDEGEKLGYSSDYYEHRMASALESGNKIAFRNAKRNWAREKAKEDCNR